MRIVKDRKEPWANTMSNISTIYIPVGSVIAVTWKPKVTDISADMTTRGVTRCVGTVVENHRQCITIRVDCSGGYSYFKTINKVDIFTGEVTIKTVKAGKLCVRECVRR